MASGEHPLKKRKLFEHIQNQDVVISPAIHSSAPASAVATPTFVSPSCPSPPFSQALSHSPAVPPPFPPPQEEILRKRRNRDEIRSLYESYRKIKYCVDKKEPRIMQEFEKAYLALISASRGCTSVQRIVAELIPRYASYCPTALEAAAKVLINMYNWSFSIIVRGDDADGVAFQTAKACVYGLVDICCTASYEAPTLSVIRGICSAVFYNVLTFFISALDGKDIYNFGALEIAKLEEPREEFLDSKKESIEDGESAPMKLFKHGALALLWIFLAFPKNLLAACFELVSSGKSDAHQKQGLYFLTQVMTHLNPKACAPGDLKDVKSSTAGSVLTSEGANEASSIKSPPDGLGISGTKICLMKVAVTRDPSLRFWLSSRFNRNGESLISKCSSDIRSSLEFFIATLSHLLEEGSENAKDSEDIIAAHESSREVYIAFEKFDGQNVKPSRSHATNIQSATDACGHSISEKESREHVDLLPDKSDLVKTSVNNERLSSITGGEYDHEKINSSGCVLIGDEGCNVDRRARFDMPLSASNNLPEHLRHSHQPAFACKSTVWYSDGDVDALDVFPASRQLCVSALGCDASETAVRLQFEDFGHLEQFIFVPSKEFALFQYRNVMDAIKAREYMQGSSPWGGCLKVKFLDAGLGCRGAVSGSAVGESCLVYVGNVESLEVKNEMINLLIKVGLRITRVVDLTSESALLLEFGNAEEAATSMTLIRKLRKSTSGHASPASEYATNPSHENRSPLASNFIVMSTENCSNIESQLSSLFTNLCARYRINQNLVSHEVHRFKNIFPDYAGDKVRGTMNTLRIVWPNVHPVLFTDNDIMTLCDIAVRDIGSVVCVIREATQSSCWFVEFSNADAAVTALNNIENCPGMFLKIELRSSGATSYHDQRVPFPEPNSSSHFQSHAGFAFKPDVNIDDAVFTVSNVNRIGNQAHHSHARQSWSVRSSSELKEVGPALAGSASSSGENFWHYQKPEFQPLIHNQRSIRQPAMGPPVVHDFSFAPPVHPPSIPPWHNNVQNPSPPLSQMSNVCPTLPFIPSSVTPLSQLNDHTLPIRPTIQPPPPPPDVLSELPSPPPLPPSQPPSIPPPPSSPPPPQPVVEVVQVKVPSRQYQWQGTLSKSGIHYCTIHAVREESNVCKYAVPVSEPVDWPARLDVTKRTDFRHVKATFCSTPPHKREVCCLLPSSINDLKGFNDFIAYLKQRECAGVIKIPVAKTIWARLLFILPSSAELSSLIAINHRPSEGLFALLLPKDTSSD